MDVPRIDDETGRAALATVRAAGSGNVGVADAGDLGSAVDPAWIQNSPVGHDEPKTRVDPGEGVPAVPVDVSTVTTAVNYTLQLLAEQSPGSAVEVRVPPYGAVRCIEDPFDPGDRQPGVIETDAATWLMLATGDLSWADARNRGAVRVSGERADLAADHLPVLSIP
jgi:hypothetical protein